MKGGRCSCPPPGQVRPHPPFFRQHVQKCKETLRTQVCLSPSRTPQGSGGGTTAGNAVARGLAQGNLLHQGRGQDRLWPGQASGGSKALKGPPGSLCGQEKTGGRPWPDGTWLMSLDSRVQQGRQKGLPLGLLLDVAPRPQARPAHGGCPHSVLAAPKRPQMAHSRGGTTTLRTSPEQLYARQKGGGPPRKHSHQAEETGCRPGSASVPGEGGTMNLVTMSLVR